MPDGTSVKFVENLEKDLAALDGVDAKIASGGGRMGVTMDRYEVPQATRACLMPGEDAAESGRSRGASFAG